MARKHAHQIFGNNLIIWTFVLQFTSHFLVLTRCTRIIMESFLTDEDKKNNRYCDGIRNCAPGQHVMCLFGAEPGTMGPRCSKGRTVSIHEEAEILIMKTLNGFRSKCANAKETGKGGVPLPRAYGVMKLEWSNTLARIAQVWANQCVARLDLCRATEQYPNAGQMVSIQPFSYPDFEADDTEFQLKKAEATPEKTEYAIKNILEDIHDRKRSVTADMIRSHPGNGQTNPYLLAIYANSNRVGCAMSTYIDYYNKGPNVPIIYHIIQLVCNFSNMPKNGEYVYNTNPATLDGNSPCGCPPAAIEDRDCLCTTKREIPNNNDPEEPPNNDRNNKDTHDKPDKKDGNNNGNNDNGKNSNGNNDNGKNSNGNNDNGKDNNGNNDNGKNSNGNNDNGKNSNGNNDSGKDNNGNKNADQNGDNKDGNSDNDSGSGGCGVDKNCKPSVVLMPIFTMENADSDKLNQLDGLETTTMNAVDLRKMRIRQRIRDRVKNVRDRYFNNYVMIEPGTRFSDGGPIDDDTFALSKYDPPNPQPNVNRNQITKYSLTKKRPKINIKPRRDFSHLEELVSDYLLYKHNKAVNSPGDDDRSFNDIIHTTARKSFVPYDDRRPNYQARFGTQPSIRKLRYGVQGFNYNKAPYINNFNDDHDQLASDLYNLEQKSKDIAYNGDINEMYRPKTRTTADNIPRLRAYPYSNLLRSTKKIRNDNFMDNIDPMDYVSDDNEDPSDIDYDHKTVEAQRDLNWPVTRNQNPLHTKYGTSNIDYYRHYGNDKGHRVNERVKPKSMLMNLADDVHFDNEVAHTNHIRRGYSGRTRPYGYDKNELKSYYFDLLKRARPFKRPKDTGLGQSSEFHRRRDSNEAEQKLRYFVPDRANLVRGY